MIKNIWNKIFYEYYLLIIFIYFIIFNIFITNLVITGIIYNVYLILLNILTMVVILKCNDTLKYKDTLYVLFIINIIFSKNIFYTILLINMILFITILNIDKNENIRILALAFLVIIIFNFRLIIYTIGFCTAYSGLSQSVDEGTHYDCNNYEIYIKTSWIENVRDYKVIKRYKIIELNNIVEIVYNKCVGDTLEEYNDILEEYECRLVG